MDKVQKIREEIEKKLEIMQYQVHRKDAYKELKDVLAYIDSLQEEPKFKTGDRIKPIDSCLGSPRTIVDICDSWYVTDQGTLDFEYEDNWELVEEPVSEELSDYINELSKQFPEVSFAKLSRIAVRVAKWQKKQDQSTIELAEDHAYFAGMEKMKGEMMKDATDVTVYVDTGGYPYIPQMELYDYDKDIPLAKEGDKYKVVLIKEE